MAAVLYFQTWKRSQVIQHLLKTQYSKSESVGALATTEKWKQTNTKYRQKVFYATSSIQNLSLEQWSTLDSK